jgi:TonB family protein
MARDRRWAAPGERESSLAIESADFSGCGGNVREPQQKAKNMSQQNSVEVQAQSLQEMAKEWEGQLVNGAFPLREYLGGSDCSAVFLTDCDRPDDHQAPRPAAIKFLLADVAHAELQFERWESAIDLAHPHLIRIFQIGRCRMGGVNLVFAVMEYAEENLSQILPQRTLTPEEARGVLAPALEALAYLHEKGFTHGHIKPSNILASGDQVKLSSDRLCPLGETPARLTPHLSDEVLLEEANGLSPADDVWDMGMLLVEVLTQSASARDRSSQAEPVVPVSLPAPFFDVARNCLRSDPRRRWSVSDIALGMRALPTPEEQIPETRATTESQVVTPSRVSTPKPHRNTGRTLALAIALLTAAAVPTLFKRALTHQPRAAAFVAASASPSGNAIPERNISDQNVPEKKTESGIARAAISPAPAATTRRLAVSPETSSSPAPRANPAESAETVPALESGTNQNPSDIVRQVLPEIPEAARDTIRGTVRITVKVSVDPSGNVQEAVLDVPGPSPYFAGLALRAAQQWKFRPASPQGASTPAEWLLQFSCSALQTKASARIATEPVAKPTGIIPENASVPATAN